MEPVSKRLRFEEEEEGGGWTEEEIEVFFDGYKAHGRDWERIQDGLARKGFRRGRTELEELFEGHQTFLELRAASAAGLYAVVVDSQRRALDRRGAAAVKPHEGLPERSSSSNEPGRSSGSAAAKAATGVSETARQRVRKSPIRKPRHYHAMTLRLTDSNKTVRNWLSNDLAVRWALAEWFYSAVEVQFFQWSDFADALTTEMQIPPGIALTKAEWGRVRATMCSMYPGGAKPRRLSPTFLAEERSRLRMHIERTRALGSTTLAVREKVLAKHPRDGLPRLATVVGSPTTPSQVRVSFSPTQVALVDDLDVALLAQQSDPYLQPFAGPSSTRPMTPTATSPWVNSTSPSGLLISPAPASTTDNAGAVTLELDLRQLAEVLNLLDVKKELLADLWTMNNERSELSDDQLRRCAALSELNTTLFPLVESLRQPISTPGMSESPMSRLGTNVLPTVANSLARSASLRSEHPLVYSCVARCITLLFHATSIVHNWRSPTDLASVIDTLGFKLPPEDSAMMSLRQAANAFTDTVQSCEYIQ